MSEKYNPLKDEIFLPIPLKIAAMPGLSGKAKLVYGYLLKFLKLNGNVKLKTETIGRELNIPRCKISKFTNELKTRKLITFKRTKGANEYDFLPIPVVTHAVTRLVTHAVTKDVTHAVTSLYNREVLRESFRESGAAPDFLKKSDLWRSIPLEHRKRLNKNQCIGLSLEKLKYAIDQMAGKNDQVKAFMDAAFKNHGKFTRKMEDQELAEKKQHDRDIVKLAEAADREKQRTKKVSIDTVIELAIKFRESEFGTNYKNHAPESIIELKSFKNWSKHAGNSKHLQ